jgi:two-component system phosphate regulon sensor histidine kinase PhoR
MLRRNSIFSRILGSYIIISVTLIVLIFILTFNVVKNRYIDRLRSDLEAQCQATYYLLEHYLIHDNFDTLQDRAKQVSETIQARITIIDINGKVIIESNKNPEEMENHAFRIEIQEALRGEVGSSIRYSKTIHKELLYVAIPIKKNNKIIYISRLSVPIDDITMLLDDFRKGIMESALILIFIALVVAFVLAKQITNPISKLCTTFHEVASGNLNKKVEFKQNAEIEELSKSFNLMAEKLSQSMKEVKDKSNQLETIIDSINEALWVQDYSGRVYSANDSFKALFKSKSYNDKYIWELIYDPDTKNVIEKVSPDNSNIIKEIRLDDKWYILSSSKIDNEEVIFVLHDISKLKEIEKFKKDFILNASHELRTPLTAIKGFSEHLLEFADEKSERYLHIIQRNTERLTHLVNDIQSLAKLEQKPVLRASKICLADFLDNTKNIFEEKIRKANLYLNFNISKDLPKMEVDKFKFEQIFVNLIDNAIRYTNEGGITVSAESHFHSVIIKIADTGIGIGEEHLDRLFERFYVVDKSRNRKNGGTGLGLSIVKHIVQLHNGSIKAESTIGKGTTFIITIPLRYV